jgi:hypothetical protein
LRVEYEGAIYHVINRGDRREVIVLDDEDRPLFLKTLAEACAKTEWQAHAYCLIGDEIKESAKKAERIVSEALRKLRWTEKDLEERRKGDVQKVRMARRLRRETTVTWKWIAERLRMGTWTHVANRLSHMTK